MSPFKVGQWVRLREFHVVDLRGKTLMGKVERTGDGVITIRLGGLIIITARQELFELDQE